MKILVILLIIILLLFVVLMIWGVHKSRESSTPTQFQQETESGNHNILDDFNGLLAPFGPALKTSAMVPANTLFDLTVKQSYTVTISPDDKHKFRQAHFVVQPVKACAKVIYTTDRRIVSNFKCPDSDSGSDSGSGLKCQDSDKTNNTEHHNEFTLTILEDGGILYVSRTQPLTSGTCKIELK